jgi:hypothetical protein
MTVWYRRKDGAVTGRCGGSTSWASPITTKNRAMTTVRKKKERAGLKSS